METILILSLWSGEEEIVNPILELNLIDPCSIYEISLADFLPASGQKEGEDGTPTKNIDEAIQRH